MPHENASCMSFFPKTDLEKLTGKMHLDCVMMPHTCKHVILRQPLGCPSESSSAYEGTVPATCDRQPFLTLSVMLCRTRCTMGRKISLKQL